MAALGQRFADPFAACLKPERTSAQPRVLFLVGDSHAAQFTFMAREALKNTPYALRFINTEQRNDFPRGFAADGKCGRLCSVQPARTTLRKPAGYFGNHGLSDSLK